MICKICDKHTIKIFDALILQKYKTEYFKCENCSFIQTEEPHWLNEAYASAITAIDVGLIYRNMNFSNSLPFILDMFSNKHDTYLDYGGGYGMFVRMMRDKGYKFYLQDLYAENIYAKYFEIKDYKEKGKFAALTTFEVFEHLVNPVEEIEKMFAFSDTIIFSTELQPPASAFNDSSDWWYFMPETGQHIAFYSKKSLEILSKKFDCNLYTNGSSLHILTKLSLVKDPFVPKAKVKTKVSLIDRIFKKRNKLPNINKVQRESLLQKDFELYKTMLLMTPKDNSPIKKI